MSGFHSYLVEEASSIRGSGLELSDWSGSCFGSSLLLGGLEGGKAAGLGFRRGEREGLDLRSRFTGERDFLLELNQKKKKKKKTQQLSTWSN